jgi:aldose sugar dehydrogenase
MLRVDRRTVFLSLAALAAMPALAQLTPTGSPPLAKGWKSVVVAEGIAQPWGMAWTADGKLLVTSKTGSLYLLNGGKFDKVPLEGMPPLYTGGQAGLLDISVHPADKANQRVYMTLATGDDKANRTTLVQGVFDGKKVSGIKTIFRVKHDKSGGEHFGSRLLWLPDATLLMSIGDGGNQPQRIGNMLAREQAQNLGSHQGAILHLTDAGKPAPGNTLAARPGALPELWTKGHRNIQGMAIDAATGRVWASEHGPRGGDEVNLIVGGQNYGWPLQSYGADYGSGEPIGQKLVPGMAQPLLAWVPSPAPSGLAYYTGSHFPAWQGSLFSGSLAGQEVRRIGLDKDGKVVAQDRLDIGKRVRDVRQGPDGHLYLLTDESNGKLIRIIPG